MSSPRWQMVSSDTVYVASPPSLPGLWCCQYVGFSDEYVGSSFFISLSGVEGREEENVAGNQKILKGITNMNKRTSRYWNKGRQ